MQLACARAGRAPSARPGLHGLAVPTLCPHMTHAAPCPRSEDNGASATKDSRGWQPLPRDHLCLHEGYQPRHPVLGTSTGTNRAGAERGHVPDQLWLPEEPHRPQTFCASRTRAKTCQPLSAARHGEGVPCSVGDEGVPQPSLALGWWGTQDWPCAKCRNCRWGPGPGKPSGFRGTPLTDTEKQKLWPSPGPAGRSVKVTLSPVSHRNGQGTTVSGARVQPRSLSPPTHGCHAGVTAALAPHNPVAARAGRGIWDLRTPSCRSPCRAGSEDPWGATCLTPTREQHPKSRQMAETRDTGQLGLTG